MTDLLLLKWLWRENHNCHLKWKQIIDLFGIAYEKAYETHEKTVKDQQKADALKYDIAFSVLGLVTWGTTKWLSTAVKTNTIKDWVFEPLVEVSKVGAGYIGKSLSQKGQAPGISLSKSPFEYHKNLLMAVRQQVIVANDFLQKEITSLEIQKEKGLPQVVSAKSFKIRQRIERTPFFNVPPLSLFDKKTIEEEMERAMWAQWVGKNFTAKHKQISYVGGMILNTTTPAHFGRPGGTIEDRLTTLKVKIDGKPLDFGNWTTETEAKKLILWGRNYRPKQFGSPLNKRWL